MRTRRSLGIALILILVLAAALASGCGPKKEPEVVTPPVVEPETRDTPPPREVEVVPDDAGAFEPDEPREVPDDTGMIREGQRLPGLNTVYFAFDRHDLSEDSLRTLKDNASTIMANPGWSVRVEGHCDERGTIEYNLELGAQRARAVLDYLVSLGVSVDQLDLRSYGEEKPADLGQGEAAWSRNRRAEFVAGG